jgi:hypothetical protein
MTDAAPVVLCPECPRLAEVERRQDASDERHEEAERRARQMEERQARQDRYLLEVRRALKMLEKSHVDARAETHEQLCRLEAMLKRVVVAVEPQVGGTVITPIAVVPE